jgi:ADP-heptose:LPS heptosyltransferase
MNWFKTWFSLENREGDLKIILNENWRRALRLTFAWKKIGITTDIEKNYKSTKNIENAFKQNSTIKVTKEDIILPQ